MTQENIVPSRGGAVGGLRHRRLGLLQRRAVRPAVPQQPAASSGGGESTAPSADAMADLVAAAKAEGGLTTIALPHDWCNYGEVDQRPSQSKYGIPINELSPDAGSGDEVEAIKANKDNKGPQAPDVIDVGLSFGPQAKADGLIAPYKVSTWDSIPDTAKDADGYWYGDYYGVLSFETNTAVVSNSADRTGPTCSSRPSQPGRPGRRPARLEPGDPERLRGGPRQRRLARQRPAGPRLLQEAERRRQPRARRSPSRARSTRARRRSRSAGPTTPSPTATPPPATRRST